MRNIYIIGIFLSIIFISSSLHLTGRTSHKYSKYELKHNFNYYGRQNRNHKTQEYANQVIENNQQFIKQFNEANQKMIRQAQANGTTKGHGYKLGQNQFIGLTEEEAQNISNGFIPPSIPSQDSNQHEMSQNSREKNLDHFENQMRNHFFKFSDPVKSHHLQGAYQQGLILNSHDMRKNVQTLINHNLNRDQNETFKDPNKINSKDLEDLYGQVNSDDNFGWDWEKLDPDYYNQFGDDKPQNFFNDWQKEHWGQNKKGQTSNNSKKWEKSEEQNKDNDTYWNQDSFTNNSANTTAPSHLQNSVKLFSHFGATATQVNWVIKKMTTHIKHQGECGSCWAFATIALIESYLLMKGKGTTDLSEQHMVDCVRGTSRGCSGGNPRDTLQYIKNNGVVAEQKYPYQGRNQNCKHSSGPYKIVSHKFQNDVSLTRLEQKVRKGLVGVIIATNRAFISYARGVYDSCTRSQPNHVVAIVGFTRTQWIIRNSWGANWGEQGHVRIKKNQNNNNACNIGRYVSDITS